MRYFLMVVVVVLGSVIVYGEALSEVVAKSVKSVKYLKFDKSVIEASERDPDFYTLKDKVKVRVEEVGEEVEGVNVRDDEVGGSKGFSEVVEGIERIVNIASKLWYMVVGNKPVVGVESKYAVALPMGVKGPGELSGWSKPRSYLVLFYFENLYGMDVISVSYKITYVYGGKYKGRGKYLAGVWAIPVNVSVMRGFSFSMYAYVPDATIVNVGTSKDPIAGLQLKVSWTASSFLKEVDGAGVYYIQGDGYFEEIANGVRGRKVDLDKIRLDYEGGVR